MYLVMTHLFWTKHENIVDEKVTFYKGCGSECCVLDIAQLVEHRVADIPGSTVLEIPVSERPSSRE